MRYKAITNLNTKQISRKCIFIEQKPSLPNLIRWPKMSKIALTWLQEGSYITGSLDSCMNTRSFLMGISVAWHFQSPLNRCILNFDQRIARLPMKKRIRLSPLICFPISCKSKNENHSSFLEECGVRQELHMNWM